MKISTAAVDERYLHFFFFLLKCIIWPNKIELVAKACKTGFELTQKMKIQIK